MRFCFNIPSFLTVLPIPPPPPFLPTPRKNEPSLFTHYWQIIDRQHSLLSQPGDTSSNCSTIVYRSSPTSILGRQLIRTPNQVQVPSCISRMNSFSCYCFVEFRICIWMLVRIRIQTPGKDPENWCQADPYSDPQHCVAVLWIRNVIFDDPDPGGSYF